MSLGRNIMNEDNLEDFSVVQLKLYIIYFIQYFLIYTHVKNIYMQHYSINFISEKTLIFRCGKETKIFQYSFVTISSFWFILISAKVICWYFVTKLRVRFIGERYFLENENT